MNVLFVLPILLIPLTLLQFLIEVGARVIEIFILILSPILEMLLACINFGLTPIFDIITTIRSNS